MATPDYKALAKKDGHQTPQELEEKLRELRAMNWRMLECIGYVRACQDCSLGEAADTVMNAAAWLDQKDAFQKQNEEMNAEFLAYVMQDAQEVEQIITPEGIRITITKTNSDKI